MRTNRLRIRVDYAPLKVSCGLTPNMALTQVFTGTTSTYEPDHGVTPLVIVPGVWAVAEDGTVGEADSEGNLTSTDVVSQVGDAVWTVNGANIESLPEWNGLYEIDRTPGSPTYLAISISRNLLQGERVELRFEGKIPDMRSGAVVKVVSQPVVLSTVDSAEDEWALALPEGGSVGYDALRDRLALYEHEVANGLVNEDPGLREAAMDRDCYMRRVPLMVYRGGTRVTAGFEVVVSRGDGAGGFVPVVPGDGDNREVVGVSSDAVTLDLRLVDSLELLVEVRKDGVTKARGQLSVWRKYSAAEVEILNTTCIDPNDTERRTEAVVRHRSEIVRCPDRLFHIVWLTDTVAGREGVVHNMGSKGYIDLERSGFLDSTSRGVLDIYVDFEPKGAHEVAVDRAGEVLTDADGNAYIFTTKTEES